VIIAVIAVVVFQIRRKKEKRRRLEESQAASGASVGSKRSKTRDLEKQSQRKDPNDVDLERGDVDVEEGEVGAGAEKEAVETKKVDFQHVYLKRC